MTAANVTSRILRLIVENAPISQSELKVRTGLSMSTVSQATNRLLAQEMIQELGLRRVSMGRPKTLLGLNPERASVVGIQLNAERNLIVMTDLNGNLLGEQQVPSGAMTPRQLSDALAKFLRGVEGKRVSAIGLALSGMVDAEQGNVQSAVIATYGEGIGAGILLDRQLYRGRHGKAGEIGHALLGGWSRRWLRASCSTISRSASRLTV